MSNDSDATAPRVLRVVRGEPSPEELAALVTVLAARAGTAEPPRPTPSRPVWNDRERLVRRPLTPGRAAFRASALPG